MWLNKEIKSRKKTICEEKLVESTITDPIIPFRHSIVLKQVSSFITELINEEKITLCQYFYQNSQFDNVIDV